MTPNVDKQALEKELTSLTDAINQGDATLIGMDGKASDAVPEARWSLEERLQADDFLVLRGPEGREEPLARIHREGDHWAYELGPRLGG